MTVLYLTNNADRASTTVATRGWIEHLGPRGLRAVVASPRTGEFQEWIERQGGAFLRTDLPFPSKSRPWSFLRALFGLRGFVRKHRVDIIHCNEQDIYPIGAALARLCSLPIVVSVHFTMGRGFCEWAFADRWLPDRMFFISGGSREACREAVDGIVPEERWRLLPNGLDLTAYRPDGERRDRFRRAVSLADDEIAVGVGCAFRPRKQLEHLFDAAAGITDRRMRVFVAGGPVQGDEEYASSIVEYGRARLGSSFVFLGYLDDLRDFYNGLDVCVNTSLEEACSISVLESLACGCPIVGYPSKSVDEQVLPSGGQIVAQDDVRDLATCLRAWVHAGTGLQARRAGAREQAERFYDIRKLSDTLWDEYAAITRGETVVGVPSVSAVDG